MSELGLGLGLELGIGLELGLGLGLGLELGLVLEYTPECQIQFLLFSNITFASIFKLFL